MIFRKNLHAVNRFSPLFQIILLFILCLWEVSPVSGQSAVNPDPVNLKVGVYQNPPLSYFDETGKVNGFFIDILDHIAKQEKWEIRYIPDTWSECLRRLESGQIDLLGAIAFSAERNQRFDFTYVNMLTEWGQLYVAKDTPIDSLIDLSGRKVAVLQDDMHFINLKNILKLLGIECRFIEAFEYDAVLELIDIGRCDAGLVSQFYGIQYERDYDVYKSTIILSPQKLYWASPENKHADVLDTLDRHVSELKKDKESIYYGLMEKWFGFGSDTADAKWIKWVFLGMTIFAVLSFFTIWVFRSRVKAKTHELHQKNLELQEEIHQRQKAENERKILETKLKRAEKMEAIGMLAGGVAHDLNNILSGIVSYPELLLLSVPKDSHMRTALRTIERSGKRAASVVQDLLTLARRGVMDTVTVNLNEIIREYLASPEYRKLLSESPGVRIETRLDDDLMNMEGSAIHLAKTIMNLVSNAAEAMPDGGVGTLTSFNRYIDAPIRGYEDVAEGDYVVLVVEDTGIGISPEDRERIFEPFYTKKVMGRSGTGLGMAVVWGTIKDHSGYIDIQSEENTGTRFTLYFPASRKALPQNKAAPSLVDLMGNGETILVIDDVPEQREIASEMLAALGYFVNTAASGEEAIEYLKKNPADLLLLDMIMEPGIDGLETYMRITADHPNQKAIIASGYSETNRVKSALKLGVGAYIRKPYSIDVLGKTVRRELNRKSSDTVK